MAFDIAGARREGYSEQDIADYLAAQSHFDAANARKEGYSDAEIISHLSGPSTTAAPQPRSDLGPVPQGSEQPSFTSALDFNRPQVPPVPGSGVMAPPIHTFTEEELPLLFGPRDEPPPQRVSAAMSPEQEADVQTKMAALGEPSMGPADFSNALFTDRRLGPRLSEPGPRNPLPEIQVSATRPKLVPDTRPLADWGDTLAAMPGNVADRYRLKGIGAMELVAADDARTKYWQALLLPDAYKRAMQAREDAQGGELPTDLWTEDPLIQDTAKRLGMRADQFADVGLTQKLLAMTPEELKTFTDEQQALIQPQAGRLDDLASRRQQIARDIQAGRPNFGSEWSGKSLAFDIGTSAAADLVPAVGVGLVAGPEAGLATMGALTLPEQYATLGNEGLQGGARLFGALAYTATEVIPEMKAMEVLTHTPAGKQALRAVIGKLAEGRLGKTIGGAGAEATSEMVTEALQIGLDKGILDKDTTLAEALDRIARSGVVGAGMGGPIAGGTSLMQPPEIPQEALPFNENFFDFMLRGRPDELPPATPKDMGDILAPASQYELTSPTMSDIGAPQRGEPFIPESFFRDPSIQPELPLGTMDGPALTGSRAPEPAGGVGTAPIPPAAQGTAQSTPETPFASAFEAPAQAAPPAPPAPQEPAPTPAPQAAPAVSTAQEPPAGEAASPTAAGPIVRVPDLNHKSVFLEEEKALKAGQFTETQTKDGPVRFVHVQDELGSGAIAAFDSNGKRVGFMDYSTGMKQPHVSVIPERRRQGIATAMYDIAEKAGANIPAANAPGQKRTPEGQAFREARAKKPPAAKPAETAAPAPVAPETPAPPEPASIAPTNFELKNPKKGWKGVPDAQIEVKPVKGGFVVRHNLMTPTGGYATPWQHSAVYKTREEAIAHGAEQIRKYASEPVSDTAQKGEAKARERILKWVNKVAPAAPTAEAPAPAAEVPAPAPAAAAPAPAAAPTPAPAAPVVKGTPTGKRETVTTATGTKVDTEFEVIDAADLITSDKPQFPKELQPRERGERVSSMEQIASLAGKIDPVLLGSSPHAEHGAPIIGKDDNFVESGNGRVMALRQMYERNAEAATKYREFVAAESGQDVSQMKAPILVRRRTSEVDRAKFVREANQTAVGRMSAGEQSKIDQEKLTPDVMAKLPEVMTEGFDLTKPEGMKFVTAFVAKFSPAERGDLIDADGKPSSNAVRRAKAALLQKAYGGTQAGDAAIRRAVESTSNDAQTLINTLVRFAGPFAKLREDIAGGRVQDQADIGSKIAEAVEVVRAAGGPGGVNEWLNTDDMLDPKDDTVKQLIQTFYAFDGRGDAKRLRTPAAIGETLSQYIALAQQYRPEQAGGGLFGDEGAAPVLNPATELGKLNEARRSKELRSEREKAAAEGAQGGLFTASGKPSGAVPSGPSDAQRGQEAQPARPRESGDASRLKTQDEGDQADFLNDELRRPKRRKSKRKPGPYSLSREGEIRAAENEQIWTDAGLDPDLMELAPPPARFQRAAEILQKRFGFRAITKANNLTWGEAIDAIKDAYVGLSNLAAIQNFNPEVLSLNGRLALSLEREHTGALAYYNPGTRTIGMTRRNDAFAHEWAHALDHYLVETYGKEMLAVQGRHLTGKTRAGGVAETMNDLVRDAYVDVLNAMYFDGAKAALYIADLEKKVATAKTDKQRLKWQTQLDNFKLGHSKKGGIESEYYLAALAMDSVGPEGATDEHYWQRPTEMWARSYEAYIGNKLGGLPAQHPFVTQSRRMYDENRIGQMTVPYPQLADRTNIFAAIDTLMRALRDASYAESGNAPAAIQPTDTRYWKKAAPSLPPKVAQQARSVRDKLLAPLKRQIAEAHRADREQRERDKQTQSIRDVKYNVAGHGRTRRWLANQGMKVMGPINELTEMIAHSVRGVILTLEEVHSGNQGIAWLRNKFATDPGSGRFTGAVWTEEVRHRNLELQNRFGAIVKKHNVMAFDDAELRQLRDVLVNAIPADSVSEKIKHAAADMRRFLNDMYAYNASNGVNIGYAKNGYLPRIIDSLLVENNLDGFRAQARTLYARVYTSEVGTLDSVLRDPLEHPEGLQNIIQYVKEIAKNGGVREARDQARQMLDDAKELEKALQELKEASEKGEDTEAIEQTITDLGTSLYDGLRDPWAMEAADDWEQRIRGLKEPDFAFEKRGPSGKYTKSRVLPEETDAIMGDYLRNDPLELITTYISQSVRRVEFGKFFGNEDAAKDQKLGWKLDAALHTANQPYRAADGSMQRVTADEFEELQKSIELLVGRYNTNMTKKGLRWRMRLTAIMTPVILARSLKSQIAEPFVVARRTGNLSDGFRVFYGQMQDVAAKVGIKGAKERAVWRREMAEYFGIVADHMADQLMLQRYNLMDLNSSDRVKMARFFQVIGVHPHAMSMRRATAEIFMKRYAPKMAERVLAGGPAGKLAREALAELGLDANNNELIAELMELGNVKDVTQFNTMRHIDQIRTAINRFTDQAIQNPSAVDKPRLASMPEYSFMYGIMSFNYAYQRNVLIATAKEISRAWKADKTIGAMQALSAAASLSLLAGGQMAAWVAGMALFGKDDWDETEKKLTQPQLGIPAWVWQSLSRSGMFGAADPLVNSFMGLKYERDLTQITAGAIPAAVLGAIQSIVRPLLSDSETNTASHRAIEATWNGALAPFVTSQLLRIAGANPYLDAALGVGLPFLTSPWVSDTAADLVVGDTNTELKKAAAEGDIEAIDELQQREADKAEEDANAGFDELGPTQ